MCFDHDALPPVPPVSGGSVFREDLVLSAADGNTFAAMGATGDNEAGSAVVVLPDVRGLYPFYEELAAQLAAQGYDAVAFDYFGRTAGVGKRGDDFSFMDHVEQTTFDGIRLDVAAAVENVRREDPARKVFTIGFCFGGSNSWHQAANGHGLAGAVGFYGHPNRLFPPGAAPVVERVYDMECPILGLMGGADPSIPAEEVERFDAALSTAGVAHEIVTYPGAPHSFFDRAYDKYQEECDDAWQRLLEFFGTHS
ncbi:MAG: dienelactone hydrolase family protein [Acidimicrobiia bacterium]